jgi:PKD domain
MAFEYSTDGWTWTPIDAEALDSGDGEWTARWNTKALEPGVVYVRATFQPAEGLPILSPTIATRLARAPIAVVAASVQPDGTVEYDGSQSSDPDPGGQVVQWLWDFGDGTSGTGPLVSRTYASLGASYSGSLTVVDGDGDTAAAYFVVSFLPAPGIKPEEKCTCKSISLRGQKLPEKALGPKGDGSKAWPTTARHDGQTLGPLSKNPGNKRDAVGYAWEVAVDVDGDPGKCGEIQVVKRTWVATETKKESCDAVGGTWNDTTKSCTSVKKWSGTKKDLDLDGKADIEVETEAKCTKAGGSWDKDKSRCTLQFPRSGTKYGPDETLQGEEGGAYESPFDYKVHVEKKIVWWDAPYLVGGGVGTTGAWDFVSLIRGTDKKYCYVGFSQTLEKKMGGPEETLTQTTTGVGKDSVPGLP